MIIQYGIKFMPHKRSKHDLNALIIRMRVTLRGCTPIDFSTGISVSLSSWDAENQRVISSDDEASRINRTLEEYRNIVEDTMSRYELVEHRTPSVRELKDTLNAELNRKKDDATPFFSVFDTFTESAGMKSQWSRSTYQKFHTLKNHLMRFDPHITFQDITENKLEKYMQYLYARHF